ncbi:10251_t:CDS:2 [Acaulospora morrowiae]|uniref:10251_t:CDS:1 n=1 Tax=Acaulospora morrowiae TaxID=94023 RepID=A0A9N8VKS3_9GLOM|nr:10251_t:CDS:2 [Acaulospora morrowiae]
MRLTNKGWSSNKGSPERIIIKAVQTFKTQWFRKAGSGVAQRTNRRTSFTGRLPPPTYHPSEYASRSWSYQVTENLLKERGYGTGAGSSARPPASSAEAAGDLKSTEVAPPPVKALTIKADDTRTKSRSIQNSSTLDKSKITSTRPSILPNDSDKSLQKYQIPASILDKGKSIELSVIQMDSDDKRQSQASSGSGSLPSWAYEYYSHNQQQQFDKDPEDPDIILPEASTSAAAGGSGSPNDNNNNEKNNRDGSSNLSSSQPKSSQSSKPKRNTGKGKLPYRDSSWRETRKNYLANLPPPKPRIRPPPEPFVICPYGSVLFVLGFILPPLWWFGSFFPRHSKGMTDYRWKRYNRLMSVFSLFLIAVILGLAIWYLKYGG